MKKLKYAAATIGWIALALFAFARLFDIEDWKWCLFAIGGLCAVAIIGIEYKEHMIDKKATIIYVSSLVLLVTAAVIHFATGGSSHILLSVGLLIFLGSVGWLRLRRKSDD